MNIGSTLAFKIDTSGTHPTFDKFLTDSPCSSMGLLTITEKDVLDVADQLRVSSSCGVDDIDPTVARATIQYIVQLLASIINSSFSSGIVPVDIKIAEIIPLYKSGGKCKINNYRPISILSNVYMLKYQLACVELSKCAIQK